ncbi:MAG: serine/threonine-protein phosphatase [Anaerolineaceae bacterium]|nr:MAG: serine/threonine-protein phosphatase [Anaerolineaceae bacterium]
MIHIQRAHLHVAALSHAGMSGKNNEDRFAVLSHHLSADDSTPSVFAVLSDGIGGHRAGEVAAELAVDHISHVVAESNGRDPLRIMEEAIHSASEAIAHHSASDNERHGMGATCACAWVIGEKLYIAFVGDSRIYLVRDGKMHQLTTDHTWVQEAVEKKIIQPEDARDHPNVHVIRRYLGSLKLPEVDFRLKLSETDNAVQAQKNQGMTLLPDDILLLCSDGLTDMVWADEIQKTLIESENPKAAVQKLVAQANERGGHDNITVIVMKVPHPHPPEEKQKGLWGWLMGE